jgi:hypothetical protein
MQCLRYYATHLHMVARMAQVAGRSVKAIIACARTANNQVGGTRPPDYADGQVRKQGRDDGMILRTMRAMLE